MDDEEFKHFRSKLKKTQKQMADLLGVSIKAIHSYEQGWRAVPAAVERQLLFLLSRRRARRKPPADCWEVQNCPPEQRVNCPAWEFRCGPLCWFVNGTHCKGTIQKTWQEKMALCRSCRIFKKLLKT
ncbi:MAG: helix-turn-helix transcriptional regulator [Desulfobacterales bacterium]